jgi:outer membrane protein assembly factor BamB
MNLFLAFLLGATITATSIWPGFRGDGDSHTNARRLPLTWSETKNIAWQIDLPAYGQSSPVVWRERVFLTSVQGANKEKLFAFCYNLKTGRALWQREAAATFTQKDDKIVSKAAPTPAVDGKRVYFFFESGDLLAFDHNGKAQWERKLAAEYGGYKTNHGLGSSIVQTDNAVVVLIAHSGSSFLLAVNKQTGQNLWKTEIKSGGGWSTPLVTNVNGNTHLIVSISGGVTAYDASDGKVVWTVEGLKGNNIPSPSLALEQNLLIAGSSEKGMNIAIKLGGTGNITTSHIAWRAEEATANFASPLIHQGRVYFVNKVGVAFCLDLTTGRELWRERIGGECWASPLAAGDRVYFFTNDGETVVVKAGDKYEELAKNTLPLNRVYGIAAVDNALLLRSGRKLIKLTAN